MSGVTERWGVMVVGAVLMGSVLGAPATARAVDVAADPSDATCPRGETPVRIDEKTCPALKRRPAIVVRRACCAHVGNGKVHCGNMPHCPTNSPS